MIVQNILILPNGMSAIFDNKNKQIPELQKYTWFEVYIKKLKEQGADFTEHTMITFPNGNTERLKDLRLEI